MTRAANLTFNQIAEIKRLLSQGMKQSEVAERTGLSIHSVSRVGRFSDSGFKQGDPVSKPVGYPFDGVIVADFKTLDGNRRYVVESIVARGMLHIFNETQLLKRDPL